VLPVPKKDWRRLPDDKQSKLREIWASASERKEARELKTKKSRAPAAQFAAAVFKALRESAPNGGPITGSRRPISVASRGNKPPARHSITSVSPGMVCGTPLMCHPPTPGFCKEVGMSLRLMCKNVTQLTPTQRNYTLLCRMMYILHENGCNQSSYVLPSVPYLERALRIIASLLAGLSQITDYRKSARHGPSRPSPSMTKGRRS